MIQASSSEDQAPDCKLMSTVTISARDYMHPHSAVLVVQEVWMDSNRIHLPWPGGRQPCISWTFSSSVLSRINTWMPPPASGRDPRAIYSL